MSTDNGGGGGGQWRLSFVCISLDEYELQKTTYALLIFEKTAKKIKNDPDDLMQWGKAKEEGVWTVSHKILKGSHLGLDLLRNISVTIAAF